MVTGKRIANAALTLYRAGTILIWLGVIGHALIYIGILVWVPYFYLKATTQAAVDVMNFLPYHLTGVLGGITLLLINFLISRKDDVKV